MHLYRSMQSRFSNGFDRTRSDWQTHQLREHYERVIVNEHSLESDSWTCINRENYYSIIWTHFCEFFFIPPIGMLKIKQSAAVGKENVEPEKFSSFSLFFSKQRFSSLVKMENSIIFGASRLSSLSSCQ